MLYLINVKFLAAVAVTCLAYHFLRWTRIVRAIFYRSFGSAFSNRSVDANGAVNNDNNGKDLPSDPTHYRDGGRSNQQQLNYYKDLYHQLHNLEEFGKILPTARKECLALLNHALTDERNDPQRQHRRSILDVHEYDNPVALERFITDEQNDVLTLWEAYNQRRARGGGRELFPTRQSAERWLVEAAPLKYVDGAWLGHVHKLATPFALRHVTKAAWQVLSEELGDGDLSKNHVHVYQELLESIGVQLPAGDAAEFLDKRHGMDQIGVWKAAVAQLLISLFPNDFLPEILGFNMHFELLTLETLRASKELPELNISGYYFVLHVSIDNADSGHTAMARAAVTAYLEHLEQTPGALNPQQAWRRIQAGYLLSQRLDRKTSISADGATTITRNPENRPGPHKSEEEKVRVGYYEEPLTLQEAKIVELLLLKATVSQRIHCPSKLRINKRPLADWLSRESWQTRREFLDAFAEASPWIRRGHSDKSLLIQELAWGGKMFGAFTDSEVGTLRRWIDALSPIETKAAATYYWSVIGGERRAHGDDVESGAAHAMFPSIAPPPDATVHFPAYPCGINATEVPMRIMKHTEDPTSEQFTCLAPFPLSRAPLPALLPLWFTHSALLENMVNIPYRTATALHSQIVILVRIELGFMAETGGVAGMDEQLQPGYRPSIIDLGLELARRHLKQNWQPGDLTEILDRCQEEASAGENAVQEFQTVTQAIQLSYLMLHLSRQPVRHLGFLLGLSRAFLDLEASVVNAGLLLSDESIRALQNIVQRKTVTYEKCYDVIMADAHIRDTFFQGYRFGRVEMKRILGC